MLEAIRQFFDDHIGAADQHTGPDPLHIATAALLIEMTRVDGQIDTAERNKVIQTLREKFGIAADAINDIVRLADEAAYRATDYYQFTSLINQRFSAEQKERLIEHMWDVAYANGELDPYEEHLVRKIAELIYVPHNAFIAAKLRARDRVR